MPQGELQLPVDREEIARLTQEDPMLQFAQEATQGELPPPGEKNPVFTLADGVLLCWVEGWSQLVVPNLLRQWVLVLVHDPHPLASDLVAEKTLHRILQHFYWPGIKPQVRQYCKTCRECQLHQEWEPRGGGLKPMPLITVPFERVDKLYKLWSCWCKLSPDTNFS